MKRATESRPSASACAAACSSCQNVPPTAISVSAAMMSGRLAEATG